VANVTRGGEGDMQESAAAAQAGGEEQPAVARASARSAATRLARSTGLTAPV